MTNPLWTEVCTLTKTRKGKLRDTFRIFMNELHWCKCHSDKTGKDFYFNSLDDLLVKVQALRNIRFVLATGKLPTAITNRYA